MHERIHTHDSRVIWGKGGMLPNGRYRDHVRNLRVGDTLHGGTEVITSVDRETAQEGRVKIHVEPLSAEAPVFDHTYDAPLTYDWNLNSLITRDQRPDERTPDSDDDGGS
jgi:hypothetical protein